MAPPPVFERVCCGATVVPNNLAYAETARNYLLDIDLVPARWAKIRASLFYHDYTDYLQKYALFANSYVPTFGNVNYTEFSLEGAELAAEFRFLEHLSFGAQWTKVQVADDEPIGVIIIDEPWGELPEGQIINLPEDQGSAFFKWDDPGTGAQVAVQAQYTSSMLNQLLPARGLGIVNEFWNTPAFWTFNLRFEGRIQKHVTLYGGVDNITNEVQTNLDNARYEYNWGPLRGRYLYMGARFEL
jgi:outer membrane receptor protein involved in Fe transport